MDDDNLARVHEWVGTWKAGERCNDPHCSHAQRFHRSPTCLGRHPHDIPMPPPSDALAMACVRKLNSEGCRVEYWFPNGSVGIKGPSIRSYGNTIYDAVLEYLRVANNG